MSKSKEYLNDKEKQQALILIERGVSWKSISRFFKRSRPTILKSLESWNTVVKKAPDGNRFKLHRGEVMIVSKARKKKDVS